MVSVCVVQISTERGKCEWNLTIGWSYDEAMHEDFVRDNCLGPFCCTWFRVQAYRHSTCIDPRYGLVDVSLVVEAIEIDEVRGIWWMNRTRKHFIKHLHQGNNMDSTDKLIQYVMCLNAIIRDDEIVDSLLLQAEVSITSSMSEFMSLCLEYTSIKNIMNW